jgi:hypothetical protein
MPYCHIAEQHMHRLQEQLANPLTTHSAVILTPAAPACCQADQAYYATAMLLLLLLL